MALRTSTASGNASGSVWDGTPAAGDTYLIDGHDIVFDSAFPDIVIGDDATDAIDIQNNGSFVCEKEISVRGDVGIERGSTFSPNYGLVLDAPSGSSYRVKRFSGVGNIGNVNFNITGRSNDYARIRPGTRGGTAFVNFDGFTTTVWQYVIVGDLVASAVAHSSANQLSHTNVLFKDMSGRFDFFISTANVSVNRITCIDSHVRYTDLGGEQTGPLPFNNIVVHGTAATLNFDILVHNAAIDTIHLHNAQITTVPRRGQSHQNIFHVESVTGTNDIYSISQTSGSTVQNVVSLTGRENPHLFSNIATSNSLANSTYTRVYADNNAFTTGDHGECIVGNGISEISHFIVFNGGINISSDTRAENRKRYSRCTMYNAHSCSVGETGANEFNVETIRNCLFVNQDAALAQFSSFDPQQNMCLEYNGYFNLTSGFLGPETFGTWYSTGTYDGTACRGLGDVQADPEFNNAAFTIRGHYSAATIAAVGDEVVKLNGFDKDGNSATFDTDYSVANLMSAIEDAFTPTNAAFQATGSDGGDIGAVAVQVGASLDPTFFNTDSQTNLSSPNIGEGTGRPTAAPEYLGQMFVVPGTRDVYIGISLTEGEWIKMG